MKNIIINIGLPKCGSTSFQNDIEIRKEILNIKKIYFLKSKNNYKRIDETVDLIASKINQQIFKNGHTDYAVYSDEALLDPF